MSYIVGFAALALVLVGLGIVLYLRKRAPARPLQCKDCHYFDLEEGQAILRNTGVFAQVMAVVPPADINKVVDESGVPVGGNNGLPAKAQWSEFGACLKLDEGVWCYDTCAASCPYFRKRQAGEHHVPQPVVTVRDVGTPRAEPPSTTTVH